jgi:DNA-binding IclR family transcriptional regulator
MLDDGRWHTLREIRQKTELDRSREQKIIKFLKEYNFITLDETEKKIRLEETFRKFLVQNSTV